jgi:hypothetical protein
MGTDAAKKYYVTEFLHRVCRLLVTANVGPSSPILVTLMMEGYVPPKNRFLQESHGVISQNTAFFIVIAVKTSNLTMESQVKKNCS